MVNTKVFSKIGEYICDDDRRGKGAANLAHFLFRQDTCTPAGKNSVIRFGHKFRLSKIQPLPNNPGREIIAPYKRCIANKGRSNIHGNVILEPIDFRQQHAVKTLSGANPTKSSFSQFCYSD